MLHKRHNSLVTLAILLALVGVSKPAKAIKIAQSNTTSTSFSVPDKLPRETQLNIVASDSTSSINQSLLQSFSDRYPQARVKLETKDSEQVLQSLLDGQADLVAIGRSLTAQEKAQGLVAVPVSREKIAVVVSRNNPYDGNLTIEQFARVFRGEVTDWSELGGSPGTIQLVDLPDNNDTRQAFPSYPVFQEAKFGTGSNAIKLEQDSTEATIARLGKNGISYAVANDVIGRDDVKIVTMHQTQPNDRRYPFSQPFNLVYQGTPNEAASAYLGYATKEGGQQIVAERAGSLLTSSVALDSSVNNVAGNNQGVTVSQANNIEVDAVAENNPVNPEVEDSGSINSDLEDSGSLDSDLEGSGELNPDVEGSGELDSNFNDSGSLDSDLEGSGELNPDVEGSGEPLSTDDLDVNGENLSQATIAQDEVIAPNDTVEGEASGAETAEKKGSWWWWLIPLLGIPLLALIITLGGRKRSDREPAIGSISDNDAPDGGGLTAVGRGSSSNLNNVSGNAASATSRLGGRVATGGAALAGGTAAKLAGNRQRTEEPDLDLDLEQTDLVGEIPSDSVSEFTGQETKLQVSDEPTKLQTDAEPDLEPLDVEFSDNLDRDDAVRFGGVAASDPIGERETNTEEVTTDSLMDESNAALIESNTSISEPSEKADRSNYPEVNFDDAIEIGEATETAAGREFRGDYVLQEETNQPLTSEPNIDLDLDLTSNTEIAEVSGSSSETVSNVVDDASTLEINPFGELDTATDIDSDIAERITLEDETATSEFFDREQDAPEHEPTDVELTLEEDNVIDLRRSEQDNFTETAEVSPTIADRESSVEDALDTNTPEMDLSLSDDEDTVVDSDSNIVDRDLQAGGIALGSATASGLFDREPNTQDREQNTEQSEDFAGLDDILAETDRDDLTLDTEVTSDSTDFTLEEITFDQPESATDLTLDETSFDEGNSIPDASLEEIAFNESENSTNSIWDSSDDVGTISTEEITFDQPESATDLTLDEMTLDDGDNAIDASLEEITFDQPESATDLTLDEMTLDDGDNAIDASLEEITFDQPESATDLTLDEMTLDDGDNAIDANLEEITFDESEGSLDSFVDSPDTTSNNQNISLDDLGFEETESKDDSSFDLLSDNTADIASLSDDNSNDMNNISEWLDSLQTPRQDTDTDNISEWLDTLDTSDIDSVREDSNNENVMDLRESSDDISFQFLEDLLERDSNPNSDNK